jgi:hypothetical protein
MKRAPRILTLADVEAELRQFEDRNSMTSDAFYRRFTRGELGDGMEYMLWASLYDMAAYIRMKQSVS